MNITEYPFNQVISEAREFFWGMKHYGTCKDASEKCKMNFWLIFNFCDFFALFWNFAFSFGPPMARYRLTWWTVINYSTFEIKFFISLPRNLSRVAKIGLKSSKLGKKSQKLKISQKLILHFFVASLHVPWCFIPQKNSRASLITWLKGYLVIFTYDQDICTQSWGGNCGTPCSFRSTGWVKVT